MSTKKKIPQIGLMTMLMNYAHINENLVLYFQQLLQANDGLVKVKIPYNLVLTDRADIAEHIFQKNQKNYIKTKLVRETVRQQIGHGLFTSNGAYWLKQRRSMQPGFHKKRLEGIARVMIEEINLYMENVLDRYVDTQEEIDLVGEMTNLAFKIITKSLFGQHFAVDKLDKIGASIDFGHQYVMNQTRKPYLKPWYYINGTKAKNESLKKNRDAIVLAFIKERKRSGKRGDDLLDMLLATRYEDGSGMSDQQLLDEMLVLLVAGHETSAITMAWAWYLLGIHPEVEQNILDSIDKHLGDRHPTFEDVPKLGYALQVIQETMRLYPAVWFIDREPMQDDHINGIFIKKEEDIAVSVHSLHRNAKYWDRPNDFNPDRFAPENKNNRVPYSYLPFGGGPRLCIGQNFAQMEMQFILVMLLRRYKFDLVSKDPIHFKPLLTLCPSGGVKVRVRKR